MPATDNFSRFQVGDNNEYRNAVAVTPHDTNELTNVTRAIYIGGGSGALKVDLVERVERVDLAVKADLVVRERVVSVVRARVSEKARVVIQPSLQTREPLSTSPVPRLPLMTMTSR